MFEILPNEVLEEIAEYLDPKSLSSFECTCKHIKKNAFGRYWKKLFIKTFPEKSKTLCSSTLMKSLIFTRLQLTELKRNVIELKRNVDFGESCEFTNWMSLTLTFQAYAPLTILFLSPLTIAKIREFYERKRNTPPSPAT